MRRRAGVGTATLAAVLLLAASLAEAHDGPPFPIVSDHVAGPYRISVWTDPDATDDGSPGGQFWVIVEAASPTVRYSARHQRERVADTTRSAGAYRDRAREPRAATTPAASSSRCRLAKKDASRSEPQSTGRSAPPLSKRR